MKRTMAITALLLMCAIAAGAQARPNHAQMGVSQSGTEALFDLNARSNGPFPTDWFTVPDSTQNTGVRVNLPKSNCIDRPSDCEDLDVINELDGFNVYPRLSIPFSGPIDLNTVPGGVFLIRLGSTLAGGSPGGEVVGIDQIVFDSSSNTLYVESDALLDQHTRYLLVVTKDVLDESGKRVKASEAFLNFADESITESTGDPALDTYRALLRGALTQVDGIVVARGQVIAASVFTTQSATAILEKVRDQIHAATPDPADFLLGQNGVRTVFSLPDVASITWAQQKNVGSSPICPGPCVNVALTMLSLYPGAVGSLAFGKYRSPDYQVHPGEYIPPVATRSGTPAAQTTNDIFFNLFLPSGSKPANGWPVAIVGHGIRNDKNTFPIRVASSFAHHGIATIAINVIGHGYGALSTLTVSRKTGDSVTFKEGGRGIDQDGDDKIDVAEGVSVAPGPRSIVLFSDAYRQMAADLMQLVRVIEVGMDVDGDGLPDLDPSRIYYFGESLGGGYGTVFVSVEPSVRVGVMAVPFDPVPGAGFSCIYRSSAGAAFASRHLVNTPGITFLDGCMLTAPFFDDNMPLRSQIPLTIQLDGGGTRVIQSPLINTILGAMAIQEAGENLKWVGQSGSPLAYAPHLQKAPFAGLPAKSVLFLIAKGDQAASNPSTTAIVRAGDLAERTLYYRHDLYLQQLIGGVPANPHGFTASPGNTGWRPISLAVQDMVGEFFSSDGVQLPRPSQFFEFPIIQLPENLNYRCDISPFTC